MKILVMGFTKMKYMPYMNFYLENVDTHNNEVHVLYWNRDLQNENLDAYSSLVLHEFRCYQEDDVPKTSKITSFFKYRRFAKKLIQTEKFDFIFVLHSLPGVLIADVLKKYKGKYIFDYRDSTYEAFKPFKEVVGQLVGNSAATFVSSAGFLRSLPAEYSHKIYTSHNILSDSLLHREEKAENGIPSDKIRLCFWGFIRNEALNKQIIDKISADSRFELHYYGREQQIAMNLKMHAREIGAANVFFHGEYTPEQRYEFVRSTDLIHNIYFDNNTQLAMGNKYYDGIIFKIPQLCMTTSFMAAKVMENGIGLACNPDDPDFTDKLYDYYHQLDMKTFVTCCDEELQRVCGEYEEGRSIIKGCITDMADT